MNGNNVVLLGLLAAAGLGCSNPWMLSVPSTAQGAIPEPTAGRASILLMWPDLTAEGYAVNVVDSATHQVQGQLDAGEWTVIDVPAGEVELYLAPGHRESRTTPRPVPELLTGEVAAGRVYVVRYAPEALELEVLESGNAHWARMPEWLTTLRRVDCNRPLATRYSNERGAALHAAHVEARERFLRLNSRSRGERTLRAERQPFPVDAAVATVHYRDGGAVRGVVIEYLPGRTISVHGRGAPPTEIPLRSVERVEFD